MAVFIAGRVVAGLSAGALATVSMGTVVKFLPKRWRQLVLAGYSAAWVIASIVGPGYAAAVASLLNWRWALVLYLPVLVLARALVARYIPENQTQIRRSPLPLFSTVQLAAGVGLLSTVANVGRLWPVTALAGTALAIVAARTLLPAGSLAARPGRPAAIATFTVLTGVYFGADAIVAIAAHDVLEFQPALLGALLSCSGLAWAITGMYTGKNPAADDSVFRRRLTAGGVLLAVGLTLFAISLFMPNGTSAAVVAFAGWALSGLGMGAAYLDTLSRIIDAPDQPDGISDDDAAGATVQAEAVAAAVTGAIAAAGISAAITHGMDPAISGIFILFAVASIAILPLAHRATRNPREGHVESATELPPH